MSLLGLKIVKQQRNIDFHKLVCQNYNSMMLHISKWMTGEKLTLRLFNGILENWLNWGKIGSVLQILKHWNCNLMFSWNSSARVQWQSGVSHQLQTLRLLHPSGVRTAPTWTTAACEICINQCWCLLTLHYTEFFFFPRSFFSFHPNSLITISSFLTGLKEEFCSKIVSRSLSGHDNYFDGANIVCRSH